MRSLPITTGAALAAAALLALGVLAGAATGAPGATAAADPLTGSFVLKVGYDGAARVHSITETTAGLIVTATASYRTAGTAVPGTPFWAIDRTFLDQADTSPGNCSVPSGAVVIGQLRYIATDAAGTRHYTGAGLRGVTGSDASHTCALVGLQAPLYVTLGRHGDTADKDGPYNIVCWNTDGPAVTSCGSAFTRLAGTWSATATTPAATTGAPAPATAFVVPKGLVPRYARWYRDKKFVTDHTAPVIRAIASTGTRGQPFFLSYTSFDDRGYAGETYRIYRGAKLLKAWAVMAGERDGRVQRAPATLPASVSGTLTFCVGGADLNGNRTGWSCASLTIG